MEASWGLSITDHQAKYIVCESTRRFPPDSVEKLTAALVDAQAGLEREIKELDPQIMEARRAALVGLTLVEKLAGQKQIKALESLRNQKRRSLFEAQDEVDRQREELIAAIESKLRQKTTMLQLFQIQWKLS